MRITPNFYQECCLRTANLSENDKLYRLTNWAMGLAGETGELIDHLKKHVHHGHALEHEYVEQEIGDVLWYLAVLASEFNLPLQEIMEINLLKLKKRYPDGFDVERSVNRAP